VRPARPMPAGRTRRRAGRTRWRRARTGRRRARTDPRRRRRAADRYARRCPYQAAHRGRAHRAAPWAYVPVVVAFVAGSALTLTPSGAGRVAGCGTPRGAAPRAGAAGTVVRVTFVAGGDTDPDDPVVAGPRSAAEAVVAVGCGQPQRAVGRHHRRAQPTVLLHQQRPRGAQDG